MIRNRARRMFSSTSGRYFFDSKTKFYLAVGFVALFLATKYVPPYVDKFELKKAIQETIKTCRKSESNQRILEKLVRRLRAVGLMDFEPDMFVIERSSARAKITADYDVYIDLGFGYGHYLHMNVSASEFFR